MKDPASSPRCCKLAHGGRQCERGKPTTTTARSINHLLTSTHYSTVTATSAHLLSMRTRCCNDKDYSNIPIKATIQNTHTILSTMQGQKKVKELLQLSHPLCTCCRHTLTISCNSCLSSCLWHNLRVLMKSWIATGRSGIQIINNRL